MFMELGTYVYIELCLFWQELLALEEKMGTVSTALSEEALSKFVKKSGYVPVSQFPGITARGDDDIKCSICQVLPFNWDKVILMK